LKIVWAGAACNEISLTKTLNVSLMVKSMTVDVEESRWRPRWRYLCRKNAKCQLNIFVRTWTKQTLGSEFVQLPLS